MYGGYGGSKEKSGGDTGRFGGGTTGTTGQGFGGKAASRSGGGKAASGATPGGAGAGKAGDLSGRSRMGSVSRGKAEKTADKGFNLAGRSRMDSVTRPDRGTVSPGFENRASVPSRSVSTTSYGDTPTAVARTGRATSYPTGFSLAGRSRMGSVARGLGTSELEGRQQAASMLNAGSLNVGGKFGMTEGFVDRVVDRITQVESANDPTAKNPQSTATGLGQFTEGTWVSTLDKYRPDLKSLPRQEKLALRTDPTISRLMTAGYALDNSVALQKANVPVTPSSLYAAHFLGPAGAVAAYRANPRASAASVLGAAAVAANPSVMQNRTIGDVLSYVDKKMAGTIDQTPTSSIPSTPTTVSTAPDVTGPAPEMAGNKPAAPAGTYPAQPAMPLPTRAPKPTPRGYEYKRSGLGTAVAMGVDAGSSLFGIPGLVAQGVSLLTTGDTIGGNLADVAGGKYGENYYNPGATPERQGAGGEAARYYKPPKAATTTTEETAAPTTFADKYLGYVDTVSRPTPEQKWDWRSSRYIGVT